MPNFQRGIAAAADAGKKSFGPSAKYFDVAEGEQVRIRFLTDADPIEDAHGNLVGGWIPVLQHNFAKTKNAPEGHKDSWPGHMSAVCRKDPAFSGDFTDCFLCDVKAKRSKRTFALCVIREEVRDSDGKLVGIRDKKREVVTKNEAGEDVTSEVPDIQVINKGGKNFFDNLKFFYTYHGTLLDRDYLVSREGTKLDTEFRFIPLEPTAVDADGTIFDIRNLDFAKKYLPTAEEVGYGAASDDVLVPIIENNVSDDYYGRFFDTRVTVAAKTEGGGSEGVATPTPVAAPNNDAEAVNMEALRSAIRPGKYADEDKSSTPASVMALD